MSPSGIVATSRSAWSALGGVEHGVDEAGARSRRQVAGLDVQVGVQDPAPSEPWISAVATVRPASSIWMVGRSAERVIGSPCVVGRSAGSSPETVLVETPADGPARVRRCTWPHHAARIGRGDDVTDATPRAVSATRLVTWRCAGSSGGSMPAAMSVLSMRAAASTTVSSRAALRGLARKATPHRVPNTRAVRADQRDAHVGGDVGERAGRPGRVRGDGGGDGGQPRCVALDHLAAEAALPRQLRAGPDGVRGVGEQDDLPVVDDLGDQPDVPAHVARPGTAALPPRRSTSPATARRRRSPPEPCRSVFPETGPVNRRIAGQRAPASPSSSRAVLAPFAASSRLLLGLGLHDVGLAGHGGRGVAVRLAVDLLGPARAAPPPWPSPCRRCSCASSFRRSSAGERRQDVDHRSRVTAPTRGRGSWCRRRGTSRR